MVKHLIFLTAVLTVGVFENAATAETFGRSAATAKSVATASGTATLPPTAASVAPQASELPTKKAGTYNPTPIKSTYKHGDDAFNSSTKGTYKNNKYVLKGDYQDIKKANNAKAVTDARPQQAHYPGATIATGSTVVPATSVAADSSPANLPDPAQVSNLDDEKSWAKEHATEQARLMAGKLIVLNLVREISAGINQGVNGYPEANFNRQFAIGKQKGAAAGADQATALGAARAESAANNTAVSQVTNLYFLNLDKNRVPDTSSILPVAISAPEEESSLQVPTKDDLLAKQTGKIKNYLRTAVAKFIRDADVVEVLVNDPGIHFDFLGTMPYSADLVAALTYSQSSPGAAYDVWQRDGLEITDGETQQKLQALTHEEAQTLFRNRFGDVYASIVSQWRDELRTSNSEQISVVQHTTGFDPSDLGLHIASEVAFGKGENEGFQQAYQEAFKTAYVSKYSGEFMAAKNKILQTLATQPVTGNFDASIFPDERGGGRYLPFQAIGVVVGRLENAGHAGYVGVELTDYDHERYSDLPAAIEPIGSKTLAARGLSANLRQQSVTWVAKVSPTVVPDKVNYIKIRIGNIEVGTTFKVRWVDVIKAYVSTTDSQFKDELRSYIEFCLKREYDQKVTGKVSDRGYPKPNPNPDQSNLLISMTVMMDESLLTHQEKKFLAAQAPAIFNRVYGASPPSAFWWNNYRYWDASGWYHELLNKGK